MPIESFSELEGKGWRKRPTKTNKVSYLRPNKKVVNQLRDLSDIDQDLEVSEGDP